MTASFAQVRALLLAALATLLPACASLELPTSIEQVVNVAKDVKGVVVTPDEDEERVLGQGVAATLLGAAKPVADPGLQRYVNRVGLWVALQSTRPNLPWRFVVLDNANVNAFAAPGGYVFITRGLLDQMHSEAELAGALGHEIAHVERKHHLKALQKERGFQLAGRGASAVLGEDRALLNQIAGAAKNLYSRGLDRSDEYEADRAGAILAARAGYDPYGLAQVLQTLDSLNPNSSGLALLFKTHPKPADRLQHLEALSGQFDSLGERPSVAERFVAAVGK
jgi:predicted Zn-dependent protease